MTTAIQLRGNAANAVMFDAEARQVIRDIYAKGASDSEFTALMAVAEAKGLDPRMGHCHFVKRWDSQTNREVWSVQTSIDGLRMQAERTGEYDGQDEPEWTVENSKVTSCKVRVWRKGITRPFVGVAFFNEYVQTKKDKTSGQMVPTKFWVQMPHVMIAKCAEALALRKAFPQLSGQYTPEEMAQAENERPSAQPATVTVIDAKPRELPEPSSESLTAMLAKLATAPDRATLETIARTECPSVGPKGTQAYKALVAAYQKRQRELETGPRDDGPKGGKRDAAPSTPHDPATGEVIETGEHEPAGPSNSAAWTAETWKAHVETHTKHFAVANSYAKHESALDAAGVHDAHVIAANRLVALGLDDAHATEALNAACERRDGKKTKAA